MPIFVWLSPFHDTGINKMIGSVLIQSPIKRDSGNRFIVEVPQIDPETKDVKTCRVRVFDSKNDEADCSWFYQLPDIGNLLPIKFEVYALGKGDADFAANALPFAEQPRELREYIESSAQKVQSSELLKQTQQEIAELKQPDIDPIQIWIEKHPEVILTPSQMRARGKTDKHCATIVCIVAERLGCKACDVYHAVVWKAIRDGSIWKTEIGENYAES